MTDKPSAEDRLNVIRSMLESLQHDLPNLGFLYLKETVNDICREAGCQ